MALIAQSWGRKSSQLRLCSVLAILLCAVQVLAAPVFAGTPATTCSGDCNIDWRVDVDEVVRGVGIALGGGSTDHCLPLDVDGDRRVNVAELIHAVDRSLNGCGETPTPTAPPTATPTATPVPDGPEILFFGVTLSDDSLLEPEETPVAAPPIYHLPFGSGFSLVVEARANSPCSCSNTGCECVGIRTFDQFDGPDLQIQTTRPLGNASSDVCDAGMKNPGGVPAIAPPRFDDSPDLIGIFNDLGCRFIDGEGSGRARSCTEQACIRSEKGEFGCESAARVQFCGPISAATLFPDGDTLVSARVRNVDGVWGPVKRLIVRIAPLGPAR